MGDASFPCATSVIWAASAAAAGAKAQSASAGAR